MSLILTPIEIEEEKSLNNICLSINEQNYLLDIYKKEIDRLQKEYDEYGYEHSRVQGHLAKIKTFKKVYDDLCKLFQEARLDNIPRQPLTLLEQPPLYFIYGTKHKKQPIGVLCDPIPYKEEKFFINLSGNEIENFDESILFTQDDYDKLIELKNSLPTKEEGGFRDSYYVYQYYIGEQQTKLVIPELSFNYFGDNND